MSLNQSVLNENEQLKRDLARLRSLRLEISEQDAENCLDGDEFVEDPHEESHEAPVPRPYTEVEPVSCFRSSQIEILRRCLDMNLAYQEKFRKYASIVRRVINQLDGSIEIQEVAIRHEKNVRAHPENFTVIPMRHEWNKPSLALFRYPYFKHVFSFVPLSNQDMVLKTTLGHLIPADEVYASGWNWNDPSMLEKLTREIRREFLGVLVKPHVDRRNELMTIIPELDGPAVEEARQDVAETEETIKRIVRKTNVESLMKDASLLEKVDWLKVAKGFKEFVNSTTCRLVWTNYLNPAVNKKKFTKTEDRKLGNLAKKHRFRNWFRIATQLGSNRTAYQCLQRFQSKVGPALVAKNGKLESGIMRSNDWTIYDERRLVDIVSSISVDSKQVDAQSQRYIDWHYVSQKMGIFSPLECADRYGSLTLSMNKGKWSQEENRRLEEAIGIFGYSDWLSVSNYVGSRTPMKCFEKYKDLLIKRQKEAINERGDIDWSVEEDTILWFSRNSKSRQIRSYHEIKKLLQRRTEVELKSRFKLLKAWHKHAVWLLKNKGTLLGLICKTDAELTFSEVEKLKSEVLQFRNDRRLESLAASAGEEDPLAVSFAERGQLERWTNAMVMEAGLSRQLVRNKIELVKDIVRMKAVPVPLLRKLSNDEDKLNKKEAAHNLLKEALLRALTAQREKDRQRYRRRHRGDRFPAHLRNAQVDRLQTIMAKLRYALKDVRYADEAREVLAQLESIQGNEHVSKLVALSHRIEKLISSIKFNWSIHVRSGCVPPSSYWVEICTQIHLIYRSRSMYGLNYGRGFSYRNLPSSSSSGVQVDTFYLSNALAKMLVSFLGADVSAVTVKAMQHREEERPLVKEALDEADQEIISELKTQFPLTSTVNTAAKLRHFQSVIALRALRAPITGSATSSGSFASFKDEFHYFSNANELECSSHDFSPVLPLNSTTLGAYRTLLIARLRLRDIVVQGTSESERERLIGIVDGLKQQPTHAYSLLKNRFGSIFSWPSISEKTSPMFWTDTRLFKVPPPETLSQVTDFDDNAEELCIVDQKTTTVNRTEDRKSKHQQRYRLHPFTTSIRNRLRNGFKRTKAMSHVNRRSALQTPSHYYKPVTEFKEFQSTRLKEREKAGKLTHEKLCSFSRQQIINRNARIRYFRKQEEPATSTELSEHPIAETSSVITAPAHSDNAPGLSSDASRRSFALELAERAILRHQQGDSKVVDFGDRIWSFPPEPPNPAYRFHSTSKRALNVTEESEEESVTQKKSRDDEEDSFDDEEEIVRLFRGADDERSMDEDVSA